MGKRILDAVESLQAVNQRQINENCPKESAHR